VPLLLMAPLEWALFGPRAIFALAANAACGLLWVEVLLQGWRKIPFTCSYMPGKQTAAQSTVVGIGLLVLGVSLSGAIAVGSARAPLFGAAAIALLGTVAYAFARARVALWTYAPLEFDDRLPSAFDTLLLQ
jgi:hypothetical protein